MNVYLKERIQAVASFSEQELELIASRFRQEHFAARSHILKQGERSRSIYFVVKGLLRVYHLKDGKEITTYLACEEGFVSSFFSFVNQEPSAEYIQCIENTELLSVSREAMYDLYTKIPAWQAVGRVLAEQNYLCMAARVLQLQMVPAREKYLAFLRDTDPRIVQRTPLVHIASFLGIAPESLSRIRRQIS